MSLLPSSNRAARMTPASFAAALSRYPRLRARDWHAADEAATRHPQAAHARAAAPAPPAAASPPSSSSSAAAAAPAPPALAANASSPAAPAPVDVVGEFWGGLNALLEELSPASAPGGRARSRAAVAAFETLHFDLLRSGLEDAEDCAALVAKAVLPAV